MTDGTSDQFIYDVIIMINHPSELVSRITSEIGVEPTSQGQAGEQRRSWRGNLLPGLHRETFWFHRVGYKSDDHFFEALQDSLERLEAAQEYLHGLRASGGTVILTVDLAGHTQISDILRISDLSRMAKIGVGLGLEVFPHMRE